MKTINKIIIREFKVSLGRFLSVSALLTLGVFVLIGLNVTGPNMRKTAQKEYELSNLADARISSTIPISENTQSYLTNLKEIKKIEFSFTTDTLLENSFAALYFINYLYLSIIFCYFLYFKFCPLFAHQIIF